MSVHTTRKCKRSFRPNHKKTESSVASNKRRRWVRHLVWWRSGVVQVNVNSTRDWWQIQYAVDHTAIQKTTSDHRTRLFSSSVQKKVWVVNQLGHQLMSIGGGTKIYCSVQASTGPHQAKMVTPTYTVVLLQFAIMLDPRVKPASPLRAVTASLWRAPNSEVGYEMKPAHQQGRRNDPRSLMLSTLCRPSPLNHPCFLPTFQQIKLGQHLVREGTQ